MELANKKKWHVLGAVSFIVQMLFVQGCAKTSHSVVAATETTIGVNISQNPATQNPQAKLGYNRAELAIVPTNRSKGDNSGNTGNGAQDVADVVMELRYGGIFDIGATSGIYQRLAVGKNAVEQPGASLMFAKNAAGELKPESANAVTQALTAKDLSVNQLSAVDKISEKVVTGNKLDEYKLNAFFKCTGSSDSEAQRLTNVYKEMSAEQFKATYTKDYGWVAPAYLKKCIK